MTLPANWAKAEVRVGPYRGSDGEVLAGQVEFSPRPNRLTNVDGTMITRRKTIIELDANGEGVGQIPVVDDPDITPTGWTWFVKERFLGGGGDSYDITVSTADVAGGIDLSERAPEPTVAFGDYRNTFRTQMEDVLEETEAARDAARDVSEISTSDDVVEALLKGTAGAGPKTRAQLSATIEAEVDPVAQSLAAALPATYDRVTRSKDSAPSAVKLYVTGSSISVLGGASVESKTPGVLVRNALQAGLSPLGHVNVTYSIDGQNGSVVNDWGARYTTWRGTNPAPQVALIVAGMNDFTPYSWHNGQTFDSFPGTYGFVTKLQQLVDQLAADGVEVILATTPHRHTGRLPYGGGIDPAILAGGVTYPDAVYTPDGSPGNPHVRPYALPSGETIDVEYRFLRGNEAIRSIATEKGCVLLDAERYYFEAVAKHGQDALYDSGQYNHPNDFGIAQSYGRAAAALRLGLRKPTMQATAKKVTSAIGASVFARRTSSLQRTTTALSIDPQLQVPLAAGTYIVDAALSFYQNGTDATDLKIQPSAPGDAVGAWGLIGPATTTTDVKAGDASHQAQLNLTSASNVGMIQNQPTLITFRSVVTIVTAGTYGIQWAPVTNPGAIFINSPLSHMRVTRVA